MKSGEVKSNGLSILTNLHPKAVAAGEWTAVLGKRAMLQMMVLPLAHLCPFALNVG
jgi:hypothetical protein